MLEPISGFGLQPAECAQVRLRTAGLRCPQAAARTTSYEVEYTASVDRRAIEFVRTGPQPSSAAGREVARLFPAPPRPICPARALKCRGEWLLLKRKAKQQMANNYTPASRNREAFDAMTEAAGNVPPQAVELEEAVLGALMLEKDSIIAVQEYVTPEAFYTEEHRLIYKAINELSMELKPIDLFTVTERLKSRKELKKVGGAAYLAQLTQKVGSAANVEFHAKIIAQKYVQRELIRSATEIQKRSYDESTDVTELIGFAEGEIFKVSEGHVKRSVQSSKDILARALAQIEEASKNTNSYNGVPSGFMAIDRVTLGWQLSDLIIIAARPSMGKTAFVLSMARNMAVDYEQGVAFFSLEMSAVQLMMRLIIAETGLSGTDVKSGRLSPEQWRHLESATRPLSAAPLFIDDTPALSVFEFRSKARRLKIHNDIKIIIIDYLQLMTGNTDVKNGNREQEVAFISRTLKAIAKELNVPIIALSQLSRQTEMRGGSKRPQLSDLRESGAIEQDADIVAFIHRPEYYGIHQDENGMPTDGMAEIIIAKHRNGAVCDVNLRFIKEQARFLDVDEAMLPPQQASEAQQAYDDYASGGNTPIGGGLNGATGGDEFGLGPQPPVRMTPGALDEEAPF